MPAWSGRSPRWKAASYGLAFASGAAATHTIATLVGPNEQVVISDDVYGGTFRLFERVLRDLCIDARYVDLSGDDPAAALAGRADAR